ncbi:SRPBCC family protein [Vibrio makurazakiensis]|uniref:SRPBCC family protein n=1 Tax=Vibrio makurazakiensis TaxID=2910250 RepID=UPI003D0FEEA9
MGHCYNTSVINAPVDKVWETIHNFHDLAWADQVVTKVEIVGTASGTQVGAKRILNDAFQETLLSVDAHIHTFTYQIDDGPGPIAKDAVDNYLGKVSLYPITDSDQTFIEWTSTYESDSDNEVAEFCDPIYTALIGSLKSKF